VSQDRLGLESPSTYQDQKNRDGSTARERPGGTELTDRAKEQLDSVKDQAVAVKDEASERLEMGRERVAEGAAAAAERVREESESRGGIQAKVGLKAADSMEQAAGYLRDHETAEMWSDFERYAKEHPMQAVGGAVLAGFVLGRILR
jgi:ElaB/YqjD/DUF883 family membrane-anchored ribosome-binding protein